MKITAFYIAEQIQLRTLRQTYAGQLLQENPSELFYRVDEDGYLYIFDYGAVVFANLADAQVSQHLAFFQPYCINSMPQPLRDDFDLLYEPGAELDFQFESVVVGELNSRVVRIIMLNIAYSVAMDFFTERAQGLLRDIHKFTQQMAQTGAIEMSRRNMLKFIGNTLNNKNRIVENLFIFDSPDLTWENEYLDRIHAGLTRTFELNSRFKEIEYTFKVIDDNLTVFREFYLHRESSKLEWIIIILICIEVIDLFVSRLLQKIF